MGCAEFRSSLKDKRILVVGLGKSGRAAASVLTDLGACVSVHDGADPGTIGDEYISYLEKHGIRYWLGCLPEDMSSFDMLVLSPGVPCDRDFVKAARENGAEIIGELELAFRITDASFAAITGTNGKTTTTTLTGEIFKASGRDTRVVGNIGNPVVTEAENSDENTWMVAEVSSFQLETTSAFRPRVSAILNLTPDHLNRHKTMEAYGAAKARITACQDGSDYLIINHDDKAVCGLASGSRASVIPFSRRENLERGVFVRDGEIIIREPEEASAYEGNKNIHEYRICNVADLRIIGDHNIENALAAAAVSFYAGIEPGVIGEVIKAFPGVEHRIEFCREHGGVSYYNDSKGTNVDAAVIALKALRNNIILIAGGDGKSQDFTDLARELEGRVKTLILLGRDAPLIEEAAVKEGFDRIIKCSNMEECVRAAADIAKPGDKVLLSPACASWDMYDNYEVRGRHFKECVNSLG